MRFGLDEADLDAIQAVFRNCVAVEEAVLFGSRAKGCHKPYSDIDIALRGAGLTLEAKWEIEAALDDLLLPQNNGHRPLRAHHQR